MSCSHLGCHLYVIFDMRVEKWILKLFVRFSSGLSSVCHFGCRRFSNTGCTFSRLTALDLHLCSVRETRPLPTNRRGSPRTVHPWRSASIRLASVAVHSAMYCSAKAILALIP